MDIKDIHGWSQDNHNWAIYEANAGLVLEWLDLNQISMWTLEMRINTKCKCDQVKLISGSTAGNIFHYS